ncbi:unnamed protein product [Adineta steineri]|uniref:Uncharacterized protein n=1 Tax=Adineta steineri TaxID=433720 RepID=A0A819TPX7_9BILA|nr:unnamed protein product [Adineta steineri]CAF4076751.1 unnamed protein product [Adineta steineri]
MDSSPTLSIQNFTIIWLTNIKDDTNSLIHLQRIFNTSRKFTEAAECIKYITEFEANKVFMIIDCTFENELISFIDELPQINSIYLLKSQQIQHHFTDLQSTKIKGTFDNIESICNLIKGNIQRWNDTEFSISSISPEDISSNDLNRLDQSFMYSQLIKEILLDIEYNLVIAKTELTEYCRHIQSCGGTKNVSSVIDEFKRDYDKHSPVWWYTRDCFTYDMLNKALRDQDAKTLIKMGFFLRDVHRRIEYLHSMKSLNQLIVYRGQGMHEDEFKKKILMNPSGLLSFNNFLSTSRNYGLSKGFADLIPKEQTLVGIVFEMDIDGTISSAPFAELEGNDSCFGSEKEILFSMHTIFRIGEVEEIDNRLWYVRLKLTSDHDKELLRLSKKICREIRGNSPRYRLSHLLGKMGKFNDATGVLLELLNTISENNWIFRAAIDHQLGVMHRERREYDVALSFYNAALKYLHHISPIDHQSLGITYSDIGEIHREQGDNTKALIYYQQTLNLFEKSFNDIEPWQFATLYSNIGQVFRSMGDYSTALKFFRKTLTIFKTNLLSNDPLFAVIYNNIGSVYDEKGDNLRALEFYKRTLAIEQRSLPAEHPSLAITHNNIGNIYVKTMDYQMALSEFEKSIHSAENSTDPNHPGLVGFYTNMGKIYVLKDRDFSTALFFYEKARHILEKNGAPDNPDLAIVYYQIGDAYCMKREYWSALDFLEKALKIQEKSLLSDHLSKAYTYVSMAKVFYGRLDDKKASKNLKFAFQIALQDKTPAHKEAFKKFLEIATYMCQNRSSYTQSSDGFYF